MVTILQHILMFAGAIIATLVVGGFILVLAIVLDDEFNKLFADIRRQNTTRN